MKHGVLAFALFVSGLEASTLPMPTANDYSQIWWVDGFPNLSEDARWIRKIQTGYYTMEFNTQTLEIPQLGPGSEGAKLELGLNVDGKTYRGVKGGDWSRWTGPRLIESGRFFQRMDVTDVEFRSDQGEVLKTNARLEIAAWPDRLSFILDAEPGVEDLKAGEESFGKVGGGYGLLGTNDLVITEKECAVPSEFELEMWAYIPDDYRATRNAPWLVCKHRNEAVNGNFGIMIVHGKAVALMNIEGPFRISSDPLKLNSWCKFNLKYQAGEMTFSVNGKKQGEQKIGRERKALGGDLIFGRRGDSHGEGYRFRGVIDEIKITDPKTGQVVPGSSRSFRADGVAAESPPQIVWNSVQSWVALTSSKGRLAQGLPRGNVGLALDPVNFSHLTEQSPVVVKAGACSVAYEHELGWHRVNLDGLKPEGSGNDVIDRVTLTLSNPTDREEMARLMFEKKGAGFRGRLGSPITGISAILRDSKGNPTGIPVQLSKNWHRHELAGVYDGQWFHGVSQLRLPPNSTMDLELVTANGHWGGVPAASHAQLSLVGWGGNSLWEQSALGCWGESICYDPDQAQANAMITDVRPLMVTGMNGREKWSWTANVGGGDFFRFYDPAGKRVPLKGMKTSYLRYGPCLTEVSYQGRTAEGVEHWITTSLGRTDDLVRGTYQFRLDVKKAADFSRFVIFQVGSDTYNHTRENRLAVGHLEGLVNEWPAQVGGNTYKTEPIQLEGQMPWVSLHGGDPEEREKGGALANRGFIVRSWKAKLGGRETGPWVAERGVSRHGKDSSIIDLVPPPGVTRLEPGDYVEATIEYVVIPRIAADYYGPNKPLREFLASTHNTWKPVHREVAGNRREVQTKQGVLERRFPDVRVKSVDGKAEFSLSGGLGYVPITLTGLQSADGHTLMVNGQALDQGVHGRDFWQTDYDEVTKTWSRTYNVPVPEGKAIVVSLLPESS